MNRRLPEGSPDEERRLGALVRAHDRWRGREVFNLLPSENALSPTARRYLASDLAGRYTLPVSSELDGERLDNSYTGTRYTDRIEKLANAAAARVFHARFATTRPLSGHIAALSVLAPLVPRGGRLLAISPSEGGYDGYAPGYIPAVLGYTVRPLPAEGSGYCVDAETAAAAIRRERPDAVVLGQSFLLFPYPLREIAEATHEVGGLVLYDGSHVLGLIAGGEFQDPLREGADVLFGSTHKSFPGPQGGVILTDQEELFGKLDPWLVWHVFDNAHWNRIAGVAQTLLELERCGRAYARAIVANSQALGRELEAVGIPLIGRDQGFSRSHQLHFDRSRFRSSVGVGVGAFARRLERQRLLIDLVGRVGTAEVTRWGLDVPDMHRMARLFERGGVRAEAVGQEVLTWRRTFTALRYA